MFLTLTAGVWGSALAAASAWCMHEAGALAAPDEHDCCRTNIDNRNAHHAESQATPHDAAHENPATGKQSDEAHAGMNCGGADASAMPETAPVAFGQRGLSCAGCCAGGSGHTPATALVVAPEQNKVKRDAGSDSACPGDLFAPVPSYVSHLAHRQHAPPAPPERRHVLIGVFLI